MKKNNFIKFVFSLIVFFSLCNYIQGQTDSARKFENLIKKETTKLTEHGKYSSRNLYVLLDEKDYSIENLEHLGQFYSNKFSLPKILSIQFFTDLKSLEIMISKDFPTVLVTFGNDEIGRKAEKEFYEKYYPKPKGFYASYLRHFLNKNDTILYNEKKDSDNYIKLEIKKEP